jgi:hypothetical protein
MCRQPCEVIALSIGIRVHGCPCVGNRTWLVPDQLLVGLRVVPYLSTHTNHDPGDEDRG